MSIREGRDLLAGIDPRTLTEWQWEALSTDFNLSDAHARDALLPSECQVLSRLVAIFDEATETHQAELEVGLAESIFQAGAEPVDLLDAEVSFLVHYSASVSIELALKAIVANGARAIGIIEPCFDSIPQLARRIGLTVVPIAEESLADTVVLPAAVDAVFVVIPNNPTGWLPTKDHLAALAQICARRGIVLLVDCSFRFFEPHLDSWSIYVTLGSFTELDYCVIEDTGKTWPLKDLKLGLAIAQAGGPLSSRLRQVTDELLLNVSPFVVSLLTQVIHLSKARHEGSPLVERRALVERNRKVLGELLDARGLGRQASSRIGAEWVTLRQSQDAKEIASVLAQNGVSVLPGSPFTWATPSLGSRNLRIALAREPEYFRGAVYKFATILDAVGNA